MGVFDFSEGKVHHAIDTAQHWFSHWFSSFHYGGFGAAL
jgi:hypothetical protein